MLLGLGNNLLLVNGFPLRGIKCLPERMPWQSATYGLSMVRASSILNDSKGRYTDHIHIIEAEFLPLFFLDRVSSFELKPIMASSRSANKALVDMETLMDS